MNKERLSSVRRDGIVKVTLWKRNLADSRASVRPRQGQQMTCIDQEEGLDRERFPGVLTSSFNPDGNTHDYVERESKKPVGEQHLRGGCFCIRQRFQKPPNALHTHERPRPDDLIYRHGVPWDCNHRVLADHLPKPSSSQDLVCPKCGGKQRSEIEMDEPSMRDSNRRNAVEHFTQRPFICSVSRFLRVLVGIGHVLLLAMRRRGRS